MALNREKIEKNCHIPLTVRIFSCVDSTNDEAKRQAPLDAGAVLYAADRQTAGRGRRGHSFYSPATGLYMTLSLPIGGTIADVPRLTCAAAVAVCGAINTLSGLEPSVKWVNDIFVSGKKIAGILAELILDRENRPLRVIIGIGVNLTTADFPPDCAATAGSIGDIDASLLCARITDGLIRLCADGEHRYMERYRELNFCIGRRIAYTDRGGEHLAEAVDIADEGSLIVVENGVKKALSSGEISIRPDAHP